MAMSFLRSISNAIEARLVRFWAHEARLALARVLHEVYHADGHFSAEEQLSFDAFLARLRVGKEEVTELDLGKALALLEADRRKRALTYVWIAHALFSDGSLSAEEKDFVTRIVEKYKLDDKALRAEIARVQKQRIEEILEEIEADLPDAPWVVVQSYLDPMGAETLAMYLRSQGIEVSISGRNAGDLVPAFKCALLVPTDRKAEAEVAIAAFEKGTVVGPAEGA